MTNIYLKNKNTMHNFGKIKEVFNNLLSEGIITRDGAKKDKFKSYVSQLRENEILKTQFLVYNNIESKIEENTFKALEYVKANIKLMDKYDKAEIAKANAKLAESISLNQNTDTSDSVVELHENISTLIFTEHSSKNIDTIVGATDAIVSYIAGNKKKVVSEEVNTDLPLSLTTAIYVDKYNDRYSNLTEDQLKLVKTILESDTESRKELLDNLIKECVELVNSNLAESTIDEKERLLAVKEKLLSMDRIEESYVDDISSLIELEDGLSGDE
jgi:hypothetical protein